jgi:hypothetical protein
MRMADRECNVHNVSSRVRCGLRVLLLVTDFPCLHTQNESRARSSTVHDPFRSAYSYLDLSSSASPVTPPTCSSAHWRRLQSPSAAARENEGSLEVQEEMAGGSCAKDLQSCACVGSSSAIPDPMYLF